MKDLFSRIVIIAIILPILLAGLFLPYLHHLALLVLCCGASFFSVRECAGIIRKKELPVSEPFIQILSAVILVSTYATTYLFGHFTLTTALFVITLCVLPFFFIFRKDIANAFLGLIMSDFIMFYVTMPLACVIMFFSLVPSAVMKFVFFLIIVWSSNITAYVIGTIAPNRHPLGLSVSPNKSIEGFIGALTVGSLIPFGCYVLFFRQFNWNIPLLWIAIIGINVLTIVGDLFESAFKRWGGVKDSSNLMMGHGGFLDMADSILFAFPAFFLLIISTEILHLW